MALPERARWFVTRRETGPKVCTCMQPPIDEGAIPYYRNWVARHSGLAKTESSREWLLNHIFSQRRRIWAAGFDRGLSMVCENEPRSEHYDYGTVQTLLRQRIPGDRLAEG